MITVIIPTIFKTIPEVFQYTIDQMNACSIIDKVIIINNTCDNSHFNNYRLGQKFQVVSDKNYYVNDAWNKGVEECRSKYYLILNDDVLCHNTVFDMCYSTMEKVPDLGILTVFTSNGQTLKDYSDMMQTVDKNRTVKLKYFENQERAGWFILGRKEQWKPIEGLKIYFGDDFIYRYNYQILKQKQALAENIYISHFESTTSRHNTNSGADENPYIQLLLKYKLRDNRYEWITYN
jgi:hypothetical protein